MSNKLVVTINRSKWRSGDEGPYKTGTGNTELLNSAGYMCCLGFITEAVCPELDILRTADPSSAGASIPELNAPISCGYVVDYVHTMLADKAIEINDDRELPMAEKEQKLIELFKDSMYALEFVGEYSSD